MDRYTEIKETIDKKYIEPDGIERTEDVVSLFDLIDMLEMKFDDLRIVMKGDYLKEQINADRTILQRIGLFKKEKVINKKCTSIISTMGKKKTRISFGFEDKGSAAGSKFVVLLKDRDSDELYFESDYFSDKEFASKYVGEIFEMFAVLEEYAPLYPVNGKGETTAITQTLEDELFSVTISVYTNGSVHYTISLKKALDQDSIYNREWLSRVKLKSHVDQHALRVLDNIVVPVSTLNDVFRNVVEQDMVKGNAAILAKTSGGMAN